eukprot:4320575-Pleurochrysis_carterae.AAC.1
MVDAGEALGTLKIVCGATNLRVGMVTVLAQVGSVVHTQTVRAAALRHGLLCATSAHAKHVCIIA